MQGVLKEAYELVSGERAQSYGSSVALHRKWSVMLDQLGIKIEPHQLAMAMVVLKLLRESHCHKHDNVVDAAGYLELYENQVTCGKADDT